MSQYLPDPESAPELFDGIITRRISAYLIDLVLIGTLVLAAGLVGLVAGVLTLGLAWLALPILLPLAVVLYYAFTLGSPRRATPGMQMMDLVLTPTTGAPLDGWTAFFHPLLFWASIWISWPLSFAIVLFTPRRQMLHDLVLGTLMLRRSPMARHWNASPVTG